MASVNKSNTCTLQTPEYNINIALQRLAERLFLIKNPRPCDRPGENCVIFFGRCNTLSKETNAEDIMNWREALFLLSSW